jgi:hypothetical protein
LSLHGFPRRATLLGVVGGALYGLVARFAVEAAAFAGAFSAMSLAFLFLMPLAVGYLTVRPVAAPRWWFRIFAPWVPTSLGTLVAWLVGWEGAICIVFALPVMLVMASVGGWVAGSRSGRAPVATAIVVALPWALAPVEHGIPSRVEVRTVPTTIDIAAPADIVWRQIATVAPIRSDELPPALFTAIGFPRPVSAELVGTGVGAEREAVFERGLVFLERVTVWEPGRRLSFTIAAQTDRIPPATLDQHVTIGGPYFDALRGSYTIEPLGPDRVRLHLSSEHRLSTHFNIYAGLWSHRIMRSIQGNILSVVRDRAEAEFRQGAT